MEKINNETIKKFQKTILDWYDLHQRDFPWRKTRDPYTILISEVMSQQTQISRVISKFEAWMEVFPTVDDLAKASVSEVLRYWSGLGYNRRALNLKKTAEIIMKEYNSKFPQDEKSLRKLPGIGEYTARAILCFAFNKQIAVVDTNVRKVILTQFINRHPGEATTSIGSREEDSIASLQNDRKIGDKDMLEIAEQLLPQGRAYEWNQALMDYASAVLKKEKIAIPKQSKFIGSHRYYRGQILKTLLEKKEIQLHELGTLLKKDATETKSLVLELKDEGFVSVEKRWVKLVS